MRFFEKKNECCICLEKIKEKNLVILPCMHKLDKKCYEKYKESIKKRVSCTLNCPLCRFPIDTENNKCMICNEIMEKDTLNYMKNVNCGCEFHYSCYNIANNNYYKEDIHKCFICKKLHNSEDLEVYSYLYFPEGYELWVNDLSNCLHKDCNNIGNPKCGNLCEEHRKYTAKNFEVIKAFKYFTQKGIGMEKILKEKLFIKMMENGEKI